MHECLIEIPCNCLTLNEPHCRHICDLINYYYGSIKCKKTLQYAFVVY